MTKHYKFSHVAASSRSEKPGLIYLDVLGPGDTTWHAPCYYCSMEKKQELQNEVRGTEFWQNEVEYFENRINGMKISCALLGSLLHNLEAQLNEEGLASEKYAELEKQHEQVLDGYSATLSSLSVWDKLLEDARENLGKIKEEEK